MLVMVDVLDLSLFGRGKVEEQGEVALKELVDCSGVLGVVWPSPTGDVDGFQPFEAEGIAGRILYRIYIRWVQCCIVKVGGCVCRGDTYIACRVKPGGGQSPFS